MLLLLSALPGAQPAFGGDEDISPSAYQIFDPETGYMIPVDPQHSQPGHDRDTGSSKDGEAAGDGGIGRYWPVLFIALLLLGAAARRYWRSNFRDRPEP